MIVRIEDFIYKKRIDKRIKASTLSRGILSNSSFSKFEHGTLRIDKNTVEALFQRLGYGFDKLEF
ncbi:MAG: hypothetical protein IJK83_08915, partial [Clostridiales bacterium]|nr:hypothetical protein [Clostridiales bacterium]